MFRAGSQPVTILIAHLLLNIKKKSQKSQKILYAK